MQKTSGRYTVIRMALSTAHTSAKAQQSPLIQSTSIQNQTQCRVTIFPQNVTATRYGFYYS